MSEQARANNSSVDRAERLLRVATESVVDGDQNKYIDEFMCFNVGHPDRTVRWHTEPAYADHASPHRIVGNEWRCYSRPIASLYCPDADDALHMLHIGVDPWRPDDDPTKWVVIDTDTTNGDTWMPAVTGVMKLYQGQKHTRLFIGVDYSGWQENQAPLSRSRVERTPDHLREGFVLDLVDGEHALGARFQRGAYRCNEVYETYRDVAELVEMRQMVRDAIVQSREHRTAEQHLLQFRERFGEQACLLVNELQFAA